MSNNKHTPGPWKPMGRMDHGMLPHTAVAAKTLIARVYSEAFGDIENETANARVIAAAPSMLDLLEEFVENVYVLEANCSCHLAPPCNDCVEHGHIREILGNAKALIAEVKGEINAKA